MHGVDVALFRWINEGWANGFFDWLMPILSAGFKLWSVRILGLVIWIAMLARRGSARRAALLVIPAVVLANLLSDVGKANLGSLRPCVELAGVRLVDTMALTTGGMPSAHAANMAAVASVIYLACGRRTWPIWLLPFFVGLSRVYVGVHFPLQVLGGWALGIVVGFVVIWPFRTREPEEPENAQMPELQCEPNQDQP